MLSLVSRKTTTFARSLRVKNYASVAANSGESRWPGWEVVIGVEVHAQIKVRRKLFSESLTPTLSDSSNTLHSAFDVAWPGTLPKLNKKCVDLATRTALACESEVQLRSTFDRKHYFYADLPAGYQITQRYAPLALGGRVLVEGPNGTTTVQLEQIQLEQDTAKSTLDARNEITAVDMNRAGVALMEIISKPDMRSSEEAGAYVRTLQSLLRAVGSSDANMEQGSFRCDVNVSVNKPGEPFGTRCEIKNLNSVRFLMTSINCEVFRQIKLLEKGMPVPQETRGFDEDRMTTYKLRSKEDALDYRYMPDGNIPPLILTKAYINDVKLSLPPLPHEMREKLSREYGLTQQDIDVLLSVDAGKDVPYDGLPGSTVLSIVNELLAQLALHNKSFSQNPLTEKQLGLLIDMVNDKRLTGTAAKEILRFIIRTGSGEDVLTIQTQLGFAVVAGVDEVTTWCETAIRDLPDVAKAVKGGNVKVIMKLVGRVMLLSGKRADAKVVRQRLEDILIGKDSK
ncbi:hypothetical protein M422DRAFT_177988 [Sphaerobolus stellatus SS14]|uniref:Glutamyl-tRNA(Gln) amidotransferase subunit B, mitochondrial n=1 Tax=Sphaerobolus stellatus (strain SS14) TaxID=990650 RepID=A0A0C9URP3_SPHS4|nr:hypothetical protein M422DRAFT_177988 [Sphaerobolus stellatus SS14]